MQSQPQLTPEQQQEFSRFQAIQQNLEVIIQQRTNIESQLKELEYAVKELEKTDDNAIVYKAIGGIFIKKSQPEVLEKSKERQELLGIQVKSLSNKEAQLKKSFETQQAKLKMMLQPVNVQQ